MQHAFSESAGHRGRPANNPVPTTAKVRSPGLPVGMTYDPVGLGHPRPPRVRHRPKRADAVGVGLGLREGREGRPTPPGRYAGARPIRAGPGAVDERAADAGLRSRYGGPPPRPWPTRTGGGGPGTGSAGSLRPPGPWRPRASATTVPRKPGPCSLVLAGGRRDFATLSLAVTVHPGVPHPSRSSRPGRRGARRAPTSRPAVVTFVIGETLPSGRSTPVCVPTAVAVQAYWRSRSVGDAHPASCGAMRQV